MNNDHVKISSSNKFMVSLKNHKALFFIIIVGVLIISGASLVLLKLASENVIPKVNASNTAPVSLCTSSQTINAWLHFNNFSTLNSQADINLVSNIEKSSGYQQDPNCLFVLTQYYVAFGDGTDASKYYNQLKKIYSPSKGLFLAYGGKSFNVNSLNSRVSLLQKIAQQTQSNAISSGKGQ